MGGFTKLFSEIVTSSIWSEDNATRIVWITMLALKDKDGYVPAALPGLANAARVTIAECEASIQKLEAPDKYSRSTANDGRRIEKVDGGWLVLNHYKFRDNLSDNPIAIAARERQRRHREKLLESEVCDKGVTKSVTRCDPVSVLSPSLSSSSKKEGGGGCFQKPTPEAVTEYAKSIGFDLDGQAFVDFYASKGWMVGKSPMKDWQAAVRTWKARPAYTGQGKTSPGQHETFPNELLKQLDELRRQRATIYNRHEENGKIPESKPQARKDHAELCDKIRELEKTIRMV